MASVEARGGLMRYKPHNGFGPTKDNPHQGMAAFLLSDRVQKWADDGAKLVARLAEPLTPRSKGKDDDHVHMADQYEVEEIPPVILARERNARRASQVINHARNAVFVEFGSRGRPGKRPLARAGMLVGEFHPGRRSEE